MKFILKSALLAISLCICTTSAWAIPKDLAAKSEYILAQKKFNAFQYIDALKHLTKARSLLNKSNSSIQYLLVKSHWELGQYRRAKTELELYFDLTPENSTDADQFDEMVRLISRINEKLSTQNAGTSAQQQVPGHPSDKALAVQGQNEVANEFLPIQEPADSGSSRPRQPSKKAIPGGQSISLDQAQQNGIPTPIKFRAIVGKTRKIHVKREKYQDLGAKIKALIENSTCFLSKRIIFKHPGGDEYSEEVWLDYPDDPSKSGKRHIYKQMISKANELLRKRFPVPVLKPGVSWQAMDPGPAKVPVQYRVVAIKTIKGYDCVEIEGQGQVREDHFVHKYSHSFCYDYNHQVDVYDNSRYQILDFQLEEPIVLDDLRESRLESLTYE